MNIGRTAVNIARNPDQYLRRFLGPKQEIYSTNLENIEDYNFTISRINRNKGTSCLIRAKNEEDKILRCLESIYSVFDEIILVDNNSTDTTLQLCNDFKDNRDSQNKLSIYSYNFDLGRIGPENEQTDERSVRSFVYYSNWCISRCSKSYIFKWDADMILDQRSIADLKNILVSLNWYWPTYWTVPIQTIYVVDDGKVFMYDEEVNVEPMLFPNRSDILFQKRGYFEMLTPMVPVKHKRLSDIHIYETKDVRIDEFSHWSTNKFPTQRKIIEYEHYTALKNGNIDTNLGQFIKDEELSHLYF